MNEKQWYALAFLFLMYGMGFMFLSGLYLGDISYTVSDTTINPGVLSLAIIDGIVTVLVFVCYMVSIACLVCGWLEKEEEK